MDIPPFFYRECAETGLFKYGCMLSSLWRVRMQPVLHVNRQVHRGEGRSFCGHMVSTKNKARAP